MVSPDSLKKATKITLSTLGFKSQNTIGDKNPNDLYCFTIGDRSSVSLTLDGQQPGGNLDLDLYAIKGSPSTALKAIGKINFANLKKKELRTYLQLMGRSRRSGNAAESLKMDLDPGTYYLRVYQKGGTTKYTLNLAGDSISVSPGDGEVPSIIPPVDPPIIPPVDPPIDSVSPSYQYFTYQREYSNGDYYVAYGYAAANTYTTGQQIQGDGLDETGGSQTYEITSTLNYTGTAPGLNQVWVSTYYNQENGQVYVPSSGFGATGIGSESGYLSNGNGDSYFSAYSEADISTPILTDPTVTLQATTPNASEAPDHSGQFTISRTGDTTSPLTVYYTISGNASNSADYNTLSGNFTLAAGVSSDTLTITPLDDLTQESNETVTLTLSSHNDYQIGTLNTGTVTIADNDAADPGNSLSAAQSQNSASFSRTEQVSSGDRDDFYVFTVSQSGVFTADLSGLTGDADVKLIRDDDGDSSIDTAQLYNSTTGILDTGEILAWQWERGTTRESIRRFIPAGTYYLQVTSYNNQTAFYDLVTDFTPSASDSRSFTITPVYDSAINTTARATIQTAIDFWMQAIPYTSFNTAQNLTINFTHDSTLAAPTLATGGFTETAIAPDGKTLPTAGTVNFGTSYLNNLNTLSHYSPDTIIHEIAHVLGIIGLLNNSSSSNTDLVNETAGTYSSTSYAAWAYGELKGTYTATEVPLTKGVGSGSDLTHWKEEVFGNEGLTHLDQGSKAAISQLSLAALRDMGWAINYGAAQSYALPQGGQTTNLGEPTGTKITNSSELWYGGFTASLDSEHTDRFYRFDFNGVGDLVVTLSALTASADMRLIRDANNNGVVDTGEVVAVSNNSGTASEFFDVANLDAGTYYVQVYAGSTLDSNGNHLISETTFDLDYTVAASTPPITTTLSPSNTTWNLNKGTYSATPGMYSYVVGDRNLDDLLHFNFAGLTDLSFSLTGLTDNANMELIRDANDNGLLDTGEVIRSSTNAGTLSEVINATGLASGSYYVRIYRADGTVSSTSYSFNLNSLKIT